MFTPFFYLLRARGLDVSLGEWLTLIQALEAGLAKASLSRFYHLCRAVLLKSESEYDRFDEAFLEFFEQAAAHSDALPEELLEWLSSAGPGKGDPDPLLAQRNRFLTAEDLREMLKQRLEEQDEEHNEGSYWIGTHGTSALGSEGFSPKGIRVAGESRHRSAVEVAGERRFRDFREDKALDMRGYQVALRGLRQYSSQIEAPRDQLNLAGSIRKTGDNAGRLELVFERPRRNTVKLLLLMDSGGSMDVHSERCVNLFSAVRSSGHFQDLQIYYFHNCVKDHLYRSPTIHRDQRIPTRWLLQNLGEDYKLILIGDAMMDPEELDETRGPENTLTPLVWLDLLRRKFPRLVWINPENESFWDHHYWGQSTRIIRELVDMYPLTVEGLTEGFRSLLVRK